MLLSVIVPIYNVAKYLERALDSLISQDIRDMEIILVNDGSNDRSGEIADKYKMMDNRIKVIHQLNQGVSIARNEGIKISTGDYIGFIDPDDWVDKNMYKDMLEYAINYNSDLVICDYFLEMNENERKIHSLCEDCVEIDKEKLISYCLQRNRFASPCNKIYRADIIRKHGIEFPSKMKWGEDSVFVTKFCIKIQKAYYIKKPYYHYMVNSESASNRYRKDKFDNMAKLYEYRENIINAMDDIGTEKKELYLQMIRCEFLNSYVFHCMEEEFSNKNKSNIIEKYKIIKMITNNPITRRALKEHRISEVSSKFGLKTRKYTIFLRLKFIFALFLFAWVRSIRTVGQ